MKSIYLPNPAALAEFAANEFAELLRQAPSEALFGVALSGGRIAKPFYQSIVQHTRGNPYLDRVHFFWADERCVPPADPESSFAIPRDHLFAPLNTPSANIHRIIGEADHQFAAEQAEAEICRLTPLNADGQPILDLIILGMGEDGHVASLFPEEDEAARASTNVYRPVIATKPPPRRITIGYPAIAAARQVWVLASGDGKREAYAGLLRGDTRLPIVRVANQHPELLFLQDFAPDSKKL